MGVCKKSQFSGPTEDAQKQNLWGWSLNTGGFHSSPGGSNTPLTLQSTALEKLQYRSTKDYSMSMEALLVLAEIWNKTKQTNVP